MWFLELVLSCKWRCLCLFESLSFNHRRGGACHCVSVRFLNACRVLHSFENLKWHSMAKNRCCRNKNKHIILDALNTSKYIFSYRNISVFDFLVELVSPSVKRNLHLSAFLYCKGNIEKGSNCSYFFVFVTSLVIICFDNKEKFY